MGQETKKYWTGLEELHETEAFQKNAENEFPEELSINDVISNQSDEAGFTGRRDFLKLLGFGVSAATLAACETPVTKVIPYVNKPESVTPGVPSFYASTYYDGNDFANIIVKTREGRPIFIKGNKSYGFSGTTNARINASVLSLYDGSRLQGPISDGSQSSWSSVDGAISNKLEEISGASGKIAFLTNTIISPTTHKAIGELADRYNGAEFVHVTWDALSNSAIAESNESMFGKRAIPFYDFSNAKTIVGIGCDFLCNWLLSSQYKKQYAENRDPKGAWMSKHFQFESNLSLTGSNADVRKRIKPSQAGLVAISLYNQIARQTGGSALTGIDTSSVDEITLPASRELIASKGKSLVVAGANDKSIQMIVNAINEMLGSYGTTIDINNPINIKQGSDQSMSDLISDMNAGNIDALFISGLNPVYNHPEGERFKDGLANVGLSVSFSSHHDETSSHCSHVCPDNHYLESWNDFNIRGGEYALAQPTIRPLFDTRQMQASCLMWAGKGDDYYNYLMDSWKNDLMGMQSQYSDADEFWNYAVHDGSVMLTVPSSEDNSGSGEVDLAQAVNAIKSNASGSGTYELALYSKTGIGDGSHGTNPWLQELPDPVSKITWDNYITMCPSDVAESGFNTYLGQEDPASVAKITANGMSFELPVVPSPGQAKGTIGIALGYGRGAGNEDIGKAAFQIDTYGGYLLDENGNRKPIGANLFPVAQFSNGNINYQNINVTVEKTEATYPIAATQVHHTVMGRESVIKETNYSTYKSQEGKKKGEASYNRFNGIAVHEDVNNDGVINASDKKDVKEIDLWAPHPIEDIGHRWGMSIDLTKCNGCSACVISCHSENNVPVVGKDEVRRARDMHWLRIDRYYSSDYNRIDGYKKMRAASEDPEVVFMPMLCQHCNHAPCETVCPVAATTHSSEGLNQMTYNRCIGTRYCANNCPYKVRRFNWFNYKAYSKFSEVNPAQDVTSRMVLNPDVTVRSRGVMEKCSMCVQRIQAGKLEAKKAGSPVVDGAIQTACAEACPVDAITFGDLNDKNSEVKEISENVRAYSSLEEVGTRPNIYYLAKVRNDQESVV